jgi:glycoside/pentoside/hexuronide:cation symporter, GPH family
MKKQNKIPLSTLVPYGMLMFPLSTVGLPLAIYVAPFYTDNMGLSFTTVGLALMLTRALDILFDPLIGRLSDKTTSRFGRRRPWILAGIPLMMLSVWQVFNPQPGVSGLWLFIWLALLYMAWTMITLPYFAWGAELSDDYDERSRVSGAREIWGAFGLVAAFILPTILLGEVNKEGLSKVAISLAETAQQVNALGYITIALLPLFGLILFVGVKERPPQGGGGAHGEWWKLLGNRPLQMLLAAQLLTGLAFGINLTTTVYYFRYRLDIPKDLTDLMFISYFIMALVGAFIWIYIGRKFGKRRTMVVSTLLNALCLGFLALVEPADFMGALAVQLISGFVYEGPLIIGASMLADVIELDLLKTRLQRSAAFFAIWGIGRKFTEAAGAGIALPLLEQLGYSPETAMTPQGQTALVTVNSVIPCILGLLAIVPLFAYPISGKVQKRVRAAIERRKIRDGYRSSDYAPTEGVKGEAVQASLTAYGARP